MHILKKVIFIKLCALVRVLKLYMKKIAKKILFLGWWCWPKINESKCYVIEKIKYIYLSSNVIKMTLIFLLIKVIKWRREKGVVKERWRDVRRVELFCFVLFCLDEKNNTWKEKLEKRGYQSWKEPGKISE